MVLLAIRTYLLMANVITAATCDVASLYSHGQLCYFIALSRLHELQL